MKHFWIFILSVLIVSGCSSPQKLYQKGKYDAALSKAIKKTNKKPGKTKYVSVIKDAYRVANENDRNRITYLKKSGEPDVWEEVFIRYENLKSRQTLIKTLPQNILSNLNINYVDYDSEILAAKRKAADYYYALGKKLLQSNQKKDARSAYNYFQRIKDFYSSYPGLQNLIDEAKAKGMTYVLIQSEVDVLLTSNDFERFMKDIETRGLQSFWVVYDIDPAHGTFYDYHILLTVNNIFFSPESVREKETVETKEIQDGYQYVYDQNGNVMKDSAGNDIKVPVFKEISCTLIEIYQYKKITMTGYVEIHNKRSRQKILDERVESAVIFEHVSARYQGNPDALSEESLEKTKIQPLPFPNNPTMMMQAGDIFKTSAIQIVQDQNNLIY